MISEEKEGHKKARVFEDLRVKEIEEKYAKFLSIPDRLTNPDKLVFIAKEKLSRMSLDNGLLHTYGTGVDIKVGAENVSRALRIMDAFVKLVRARGHEISDERRVTFVSIGEHQLKFGLREKCKRRQANVKWRTFDYEPTGILYLFAEIHHQRVEWKDGKVPVENCLARALAKMELCAEEWEQWKIDAAKERSIREEKEKIRQELEKRKEAELTKFRGLLQKAYRWEKTKSLREFLDNWEEVTKKSENNQELIEYFEWARKKLLWFDPFVEAKDELLSEEDRNKI